MVRYVERHELREGRILLYIDGDKKKPIWNARLRIPGIIGYVVKSSGTTSLAEAVRWAEDLYDELRMKAKNNLPIRERRFRDVFKEWEKTGISTLSVHRQRLHKSVGNRYFVPFFGDEDITGLNEVKLEGYWQWRLSYWTTGPGAKERQAGNKTNAKPIPAQKTLDMEKGMIGQVLKWAKRKGYIANLPLLHAPKLKNKIGKEAKRRPDISPSEMETLIGFMEQWAKEGYTDYHRYFRELMRQCILIVYYSGLRPNEIAQLRWRDIVHHENDEGDFLTFHVAPTTKTGERICVPQPEVWEPLLHLQALTGKEWGSSDLVICDKDGNGPQWGHKTLKDLLKKAGVLTDFFGRERTLYSFRHTYATERLLAGVPIDKLAKNMGTSVQYIQAHYDHTTNIMNANTLIQGTALENALAKLINEASQKLTGDKSEAELVNDAWE